MHADAIGNARGQHTSVVRRLDVHVGIANHHGFRRIGREIAKDDFRAVGIGFFRLEAVPAIDHTKKSGETEAVENRAAEIHGFVRENRHRILREKRETLDDAGIRASVVEHVSAIVGKKVGERLIAFGGCGAFAEKAADENLGAIPDKTVDSVVGERGAAQMGKRGVDGEREVELRIDERAIEIEDEDADARIRIGGRGHRRTGSAQQARAFLSLYFARR